MMCVILPIVLYVLGAVPTYLFFKETTEQPKFNQVWFSIFWPAVVIFYIIYSSVVGIVRLLKKKK